MSDTGRNFGSNVEIGLDLGLWLYAGPPGMCDGTLLKAEIPREQFYRIASMSRVSTSMSRGATMKLLPWNLGLMRVARLLYAGIPRRRHGHRLVKHGYNLTSDTRYFLARPRCPCRRRGMPAYIAHLLNADWTAPYRPYSTTDASILIACSISAGQTLNYVDQPHPLDMRAIPCIPAV